MKFFIVDDDKNVQNILKLIIQKRELGEICGISPNGEDALEELKYAKPDIVLVDLLMPVMDGITFVKKAKEQYPELAFVMLSQVAAKEMVAMAYESGIEFFVQKPVNSIEVERVIRKVSQSVQMQRTIAKMQTLFINEMNNMAPADSRKAVKDTSHIEKAKDILQKLGVIGEIGSSDIIKVVDYMMEHRDTVADATLADLCRVFSDNPKSMEQRIRRTAGAALTNLANLGIEDYSNDIFIEYSNTLFNFEQVRMEMNHIRGKSVKGGNVKIRNFLNALMSYCHK